MRQFLFLIDFSIFSLFFLRQVSIKSTGLFISSLRALKVHQDRRSERCPGPECIILLALTDMLIDSHLTQCQLEIGFPLSLSLSFVGLIVTAATEYRLGF